MLIERPAQAIIARTSTKCHTCRLQLSMKHPLKIIMRFICSIKNPAGWQGLL